MSSSESDEEAEDEVGEEEEADEWRAVELGEVERSRDSDLDGVCRDRLVLVMAEEGETDRSLQLWLRILAGQGGEAG